MADFSFYGGLYRQVRLIRCDKIHFDCMDKSRDGVLVSTSRKSADIWEVKVTGTIVNEDSRIPAVVCASLEHENQTLSAKAELTLTESTEFELTLKIASPRLWQGTEDPYLYTVTVQVLIQDAVVDERQIDTGFREIW